MTTQPIAITVFGRSDVGKARAKDEDAFVISRLTDAAPIRAMTSPVSLEVNERGVLIAVSDGMGGAQAGEVASSIVLGAMQEGMSTVRATSADVALQAVAEDANRQVFDTAQATGREGMGATLTAVLFHGVYAYIAQIGDSRAYLMRSRRIAQVTRDQSYVQQLVDAGALTPEETESSEFKNVILQAMGIRPDIAVVMRRISVRRSDRFLVCSDGLTGNLKDQDMLNAIAGGSTLDAMCASLIQMAVEQGAEDDITVVLADVNGEGAPALTDAERLSLETSATFDPA